MRGAGKLPRSPGVDLVTTCSITISRPRAHRAPSAWRMAAAGRGRGAQAQGDGVDVHLADEPRDLVGGLADEVHDLQALGVGAAELRTAGFTHVHGTRVPAGGLRQTAGAGHEFAVAD